ncbi:MAG: DoxX family protein [Cyclobacteriaceae bacterium]|nr:DoxX family protein [Cyclobacteriaceae bacterium]
MLNSLISTQNIRSIAVIRIVLAIVIMAHGAQKLLGWFGGHGVTETIQMWQQRWGMPAVITMLVILCESFGALFLLVGFLGRVMAAGVGCVMLGAMWLVHLRWGFYMNWYALPQTGEGFEYHLLVLSMVIALLMSGSGAWSVDLWLQSRNGKN